MDLRPCWNEDNQECEVKVYVKPAWLYCTLTIWDKQKGKEYLV